MGEALAARICSVDRLDSCINLSLVSCHSLFLFIICDFRAGLAICSYGFLGESEEMTTVIGTKGRLVIETPGHCPTKVRLSLKAQGRGQKAGETLYEYPLPEETEEIKEAGGFVYPNSAGFAYEAAAVARCIAAGKKEPPQFTWAEIMINARLIDEARRQLGVKPLDQD